MRRPNHAGWAGGAGVHLRATVVALTAAEAAATTAAAVRAMMRRANDRGVSTGGQQEVPRRERHRNN